MPNKYATQGRLLVEYIRQARSASYGDLLRLGISTCPWRRLEEPSAIKALRKGEKIMRDRREDGLVVFRIVRA